jgi:hypothetical protein
MLTRIQIVVASILALCTVTSATAAPYELTVYSDDIAAPGETEFETIFSMARPRSSSLPARVGQMLTEVSYGVAKDWAIGIELPAAYADRLHKVQGLAVEVQYVAPHDKTGGWYWGIRGGLGRIVSVYEDDTAMSAELNPIIGYRGLNYRVVVNPSLEKPLRGNETTTRFHPSAKWSMTATAKDQIGLEYYGDWGNVQKLLAPSMRDETLYVVWDRQTSFGRLSMGLGQALRPGSGSADKWVAKLGIQFDMD